MYKVNDLVKMTNLTRKTILYYDKIGILKPSSKNELGHRIYSKDDLILLQSIMFLKELNFSLNEIKNIMCCKEFKMHKGYKNVLKLKKEVIENQIKHLNKVKTTIEYTINNIDKEIANDKLYYGLNDVEVKNAQKKMYDCITKKGCVINEKY